MHRRYLSHSCFTTLGVERVHFRWFEQAVVDELTALLGIVFTQVTMNTREAWNLVMDGKEARISLVALVNSDLSVVSRKLILVFGCDVGDILR